MPKTSRAIDSASAGVRRGGFATELISVGPLYHRPSERTLSSRHLSRREWIVAAGLGSAGLALDGCALSRGRVNQSRYRRPLSATPFIRPRISPDLVIRTLVGLRPYRAPGFVVRADRM